MIEPFYNNQPLAFPTANNLADWVNDTRTDYPSDKSILDLFEYQVEKTPDALAVVCQLERVTYRELNNAANVLAHRLILHGIQPGAFVGICMERSIAMVVSTLAILKTGSAYVPLDTSYPIERLSFMVEDLNIKEIIASAGEHSLLEQLNAEALYYDEPEKKRDGDWTKNLGISRRFDQTAYIMYTSGSTGKPKGVIVPDRAIVRLVRNTNYVSIGEADVMAHISNVSFDAATFEIWGALLNGAPLVILDKDTILSPKLFSNALRQFKVSVIFLTTALFNFHARQQPWVFASVRVVLFGGEAADRNAVALVLKEGIPGYLINAYGPTENTTFSTFYAISDVPADLKSIPIGKPISNSQAYILNNRMQPVAPGEPGELYVGGDGVAKGYVNSPDLTSEKFIPNPFCDDPEARLYKTGDIVHWLPDGNIEFLDRADDQVKIRGFRVERGEIKAAIDQMPLIHDSVVLIKDDPLKGKFLVGFFTSNSGETIPVTEIREFLHVKLPEYMIPSAFMQINSIPLTPNGKIDFAILKSIEIKFTSTANNAGALLSTDEKTIISIWQEVLGVESIGVNDVFFDLGGNSLMVVRVLTRINEVFQVELPMWTFYENPTVAGLCEQLYLSFVRGPNFSREKKPTMIKINEKGSNPPVFFVHPFYDAHSYYELAHQLGPDQPTFSFEPNYQNLAQLDDLTIETIATTYLNLLYEYKPNGPYCLCGWSLGAVIAMEMIRQINASGKEAPQLILLDPAPLFHDYGFYLIRNKFFRNLASGLLRTDGYFKYWYKKRTSFYEAAAWFGRKAMAALHTFFSSDKNKAMPQREISKNNSQAGVPAAVIYKTLKPHLTAYSLFRPSEVVCSAISFWTKDEYRPPLQRIWESPLLQRFIGYRAYIKGSYHEKKVPGDHESMLLKPHVELLASEMLKFIEGSKSE